MSTREVTAFEDSFGRLWPTREKADEMDRKKRAEDQLFTIPGARGRGIEIYSLETLVKLRHDIERVFRALDGLDQ